MNTLDWEDLEKQVEQVRTNTMSKSSREVYKRSYGRFLTWIAKSKPDLLSPTFEARLGNISELDDLSLRIKVKQLLSDFPEDLPIKFEILEASFFVSWLLTLKKVDGKPLSYSALNTHRAGLFNFFRDYK